MIEIIVVVIIVLLIGYFAMGSTASAPATVVVAPSAPVPMIYNTVPGFFNPSNGNDWKGNNMSGKETLESCQKWAITNGSPMYGYRNETHPEAQWRNTCWGYTGKTAFAGNPSDGVHVTGCTDPTKLPANGCV